MEQSDNISQELEVHFYPELFLQRRVWVLSLLRNEDITKVLDVGCGEGQLLRVLCQPAPWLRPPPKSVLQAASASAYDSVNETDEIPTPIYEDDFPNLHVTNVHGLDISEQDIAFAIEVTAPPKKKIDSPDSPVHSWFGADLQRWEHMELKLWKGGLEMINEEFVGIECIVAMEVIEHLPPDVVEAFAPMLLGVYHPKFLLVTTPSYTFNARFTAPDAPKSARRGYPDPTGRTERIFRHSDHKFEWTKEEFASWCDETAEKWGYIVDRTSIGRSLQEDPYARDAELEGASLVASFRRREDVDRNAIEQLGRLRIKELDLKARPHENAVVHEHPSNPATMKPQLLTEIAKCVIMTMEKYREAFKRVEELWFEEEIPIMCGGWIEILIRAIELSPDLILKKEVDGEKKTANMWMVELIGGVPPVDRLQEGETSLDYIPQDWNPEEVSYDSWDDDESDYVDESTGVDGDVSAETSENELDGEENGRATWKNENSDWKTNFNVWDKTGHWQSTENGGGWDDVPNSAMSSTPGWDGDGEKDEATS